MRFHSVVVALAILALVAACQRSSPPPAEPPASPPAAPSEEQGTVEEAAQVLRDYYRAIDERRYEDAYHLWASGGEASGQTFEEFRDGFAETDSVEIELEAPGTMGAAAGSRYVEIPLWIRAVKKSGRRQAFHGTYTLRRSVVDGATAEQRAWRLYTAKIEQVL